MKDIEISSGLYASHHSLTDFYEGSKAKLMDALNSGEDFETEWFGCKKEINYARICRENGTMTVDVSAHMDDLWDEDGPDLIYDALWEECHTEEELPDDIIDSILDVACGDIDDSTEISDSFPADGTAEQLFDAIVEKIDRLEETAMNMNDNMYARLRVIVKAHYEYMKGEKIDG